MDLYSALKGSLLSSKGFSHSSTPIIYFLLEASQWVRSLQKKAPSTGKWTANLQGSQKWDFLVNKKGNCIGIKLMGNGDRRNHIMLFAPLRRLFPAIATLLQEKLRK
jgi:hypothetical protein